MSGSKKPSTPRAFTGDTELCHEYRIDQIKPLIGKHLGPVTFPQIAEFVEIFPGLDKVTKDATNYIKKMQKGVWFAEKSKSAKEALERCPVESQPMFKDYHVYAEATGNVTFPDAWRSGDFHALWVGLHGWQEWKEEPKNGGYAGDNGWYRHGARLLCRVQAYYVEQKIRCYKSKDDYLKRKLGTRAAEAGQLGRVNEKREDHLDMLEIVTIVPKTGTKRKHNTSAVAAAVEQEAVEDSVAAVAQASSDAEDQAMEEQEEEEQEEQEDDDVKSSPPLASVTPSDEGAAEEDALMAEARELAGKSPAVKRSLDEVEAATAEAEAKRWKLRQDVEAEKEAEREEEAVEEEVARVYETVQRIKRAKIRRKYVGVLEQRARAQHPERALMCECGCKMTFFGGQPLDIHDMEVDHYDELADGGADDPGIDGLNLYTRICHGRKTRDRARERIRAKRHQ